MSQQSGSATSASNQDSLAGVLALLRTLRKRWSFVVAAVVLGLGLSLIYSKSATPIYQATALIEFDLRAIRPLADKAQTMRAAPDYWDTREYYETQIKILTSDRVLTRVVLDNGLQNDPSFAPHKGGHTPDVDAVADLVRSRTTVELVKNSSLVKLSYEDPDPKRARKLCDAIANTFISQNLEKIVSATADAALWLNGQVDHYKNDLEANENALQAFRQRNELPSTSINQASDMIRLEMQEYDTALTKTRTKKQELQARFTELSAVADNDPSRLPASELLNNSFLQTLRGQYLDATKERSTLVAEGKGDNHPLVKRADERITMAKAALLEEIQNIKGAVGRDLAVVEHEEAGEAGLFDASRHRAIDLNMKEIEFRRLDRSREENEKIYSMLLERMKEADLARMLNVNEMRLVDAAPEPRAPIRPRVPLNLALGALLGLMLGVGLAFAAEQLDNTLKTPADVEQKLGVTFLGLLPEIDDESSVYGKARRKRARVNKGEIGPPELIVHTRPRSGVAEAARSIRTNLLFMNPDRPHAKLLVSSAAPSEGKTTIACSIAIAMAQGGQRVCIVDCDLRRPRLHRVFDCAGASGVTNYLVGDASFEDIVSPTVIENLSCIPSGPIPPNPADLFHSERFKRFVKELGERFDRVIIDSPPLAAVTDSAIISTLVDGTVFVVRAFKTTRSVCAQGLRALADVDARVIGGVINAVDFRRHEYQYHYYYYKRDGYAPLPATAAERSGQDEGATPPN